MLSARAGVVRACIARAQAYGLVIACMALAGNIAQAASSPIGATAGSHLVTPTGAFTYSISIAVPPGTAGIEPKLSLTYSSQSGNGLLGMGWSLTGLSVIHRCPRTVVQDGILGGVNYDANDRYCLDGQHLVAIAGAYGANGTEYRTENESYGRIISYGSQGSGPAYWKVWTKSGQIIEYGNTADSRIEAQGKTEVMLWALNKLSDTLSNYLTVTYTEDNANGQFYPSRIDYTGNSTAGKVPDNSVRFVYETRLDIVPMYHAGSLSKTTVRLKNVQAYAGNTTLTRDYQLAYEQGMATQRSRLTSLTECAGDGVCLQATKLGWSTDAANGTWSVSNNGTSWVNDSGTQVITGDFNGDGKTDFLLKNSAYASTPVFLSNGDGTWSISNTAVMYAGSNVSSGWINVSGTSVITGDFNGDGKSATPLLCMRGAM